MTTKPDKLLGVGLYTPAEAALYARAPTRTVRRWLYGVRGGESVICPQFAGRDEKIVTFLDFVQTLAIRTIRMQHGVSLQRIRQAVKNAQKHYRVDYPFAMRHRTFLFGREVVIRLGEDMYVQLTGKHATNRLIKQVVEFYTQDLTFSEESGLAAAYQAYAWRDLAVSMNPAVRLGEPLITSCGYSARALWEAYQSEGGLEAAAEAYGVRREEVELAIRYFDYLQGTPAA